MIVLIDHHDSFVHNLARYFQRLGQETMVIGGGDLDLAAIRTMQPGAIVLSPGPCTPREAAGSVELVRRCYRDVPILGVCLGHQIIAAALGGRVVRASQPVHGRTSQIVHDGRGLFRGLPSPLAGCRYHSLVVDESTLPQELEATARTSDGLLMAFQHREVPLVGLQFHPESILTDCGYELLAGFLRLAGIEPPGMRPTIADELLPVCCLLSSVF